MSPEDPKAANGLDRLASEEELRVQQAAPLAPADRPFTPTETRVALDEFVAYIRQRRYSYRHVSAQLGLGVPSLRAIIGGVFVGDVDAELRRIVAWMEMDAKRAAAEQRQTGGKPCVPTPIVKALERVIHLLTIERMMAVVVGAPGCGKSFALKYFAEAMPNVVLVRITRGIQGFIPLRAYLARRLRVRQTRVCADYSWMTKGLDEAIAEEAAARKAILVVDEAERLHDAAMSFVRDMHDTALCSVALVGAPPLLARIREDQALNAGQLASRIGLAVDLCQGYDPAAGGQKLFSFEDIRRALASDKVRLVRDAIEELSDQVNDLRLGMLRRGRWLVLWAARIARSQAGLGADDEVTVTGAHVRAAEKLLVDRGLVVAVRREARPTVAAASA